MKKPSMRKMVDYIISNKEERHTLIGIGPMSYNFIQASLESSMENNYPIMFIASRNQIDSYEFGGGYVFHADQKLFKDTIDKICDKIHYDNVYYICRDHGGPWQRDKERADKLPEDEAMEIAKASYRADILNGFDLLHLDPTKDPEEYCKVVDIDTVYRRTIELLEYCEKFKKDNGIDKEIAYEIGTEETSGGLTELDKYEDFIVRIEKYVKEHNLPMPVFIVGQTGTLTRMTTNVGKFDYENSKKLSAIAAKHGVGLKEHNGDYLPEDKLLAHLPLGITAMNVAPEFGTVETRSLLQLSDLEKKFIELGEIKEGSNLRAIITDKSIHSMKWKKWLTDGIDMSNLDALSEDLQLQITELCGHYTFSDEAVAKAIEKLFENLKLIHVDGQRYVVDKLKECLSKYVACLNLKDLTSKIQ